MGAERISLCIIERPGTLRSLLEEDIEQDRFTEIAFITEDIEQALLFIRKKDADVVIVDHFAVKDDGALKSLKKLASSKGIDVILLSWDDETLECGDGFHPIRVPLEHLGPIEQRRVVRNIMIKSKALAMNRKLAIKERGNITAMIDRAESQGISRAKESMSEKTEHTLNGIKAIADKVVAIGASTGGTEAVLSILMRLPPNMPPIVIVQHMPAGFTSLYATRVANNCPMAAKEAEHGDILHPGHIYIAPGGDKHMKIKTDGAIRRIVMVGEEKMNGHCPSVDKLFLSVAAEAPEKAVGIILTGMGSDGAAGLLAMRKAGCVTIGQDSESCVVYGMPRVAYQIGAVERQLSLSKIPEGIIDGVVHLNNLSKNKK